LLLLYVAEMKYYNDKSFLSRFGIGMTIVSIFVYLVGLVVLVGSIWLLIPKVVKGGRLLLKFFLEY